MQGLIPRTEYLQWIDEFRDKKLIKVLTGIRRSGKATKKDIGLYVTGFTARLGVRHTHHAKVVFELAKISA